MTVEIRKWRWEIRKWYVGSATCMRFFTLRKWGWMSASGTSQHRVPVCGRCACLYTTANVFMIPVSCSSASSSSSLHDTLRSMCTLRAFAENFSACLAHCFPIFRPHDFVSVPAFPAIVIIRCSLSSCHCIVLFPSAFTYSSSVPTGIPRFTRPSSGLSAYTPDLAPALRVWGEVSL